MFGDGPLTFREFITREPLPLATVHDAVLEFLRDRDDAILCGAHAVNAYVDKPRMTEDVDILSPRAFELAEELAAYLKEHFDILIAIGATRRRTGYRVYQVREPKHRHLVDVRSVSHLPPYLRVEGVQVLTPPELIRSKVVCMVARQKSPRGGMDRADLYRLLLAFSELKAEDGPVGRCLRVAGDTDTVLAAWKEIVRADIQPEDDDEEFVR